MFMVEDDSGMQRLLVLDANGVTVFDEMGEDMAGFEYAPDTFPDEVSADLKG